MAQSSVGRIPPAWCVHIRSCSIRIQLLLSRGGSRASLGCGEWRGQGRRDPLPCLGCWPPSLKVPGSGGGSGSTKAPLDSACLIRFFSLKLQAVVTQFFSVLWCWGWNPGLHVASNHSTTELHSHPVAEYFLTCKTLTIFPSKKSFVQLGNRAEESGSPNFWNREHRLPRSGGTPHASPENALCAELVCPSGT